MRPHLSAAQWTLALSGTLVAGATALALGNPTPAVLDVNISRVLVLPLLVGLFLVAELFLMNVEFRRQGHSITLASMPLVLGALLLPSHLLIVTRLTGTVIAFICFLRGLAAIGPVRTSIISTVEPFWGALLASIVLAQPLAARTLAGGILVAAAVIILNVPQRVDTPVVA